MRVHMGGGGVGVGGYLQLQCRLVPPQTKLVVLVAPDLQPLQELLEPRVALAKVHRQLPVLGARGLRQVRLLRRRRGAQFRVVAFPIVSAETKQE